MLPRLQTRCLLTKLPNSFLENPFLVPPLLYQAFFIMCSFREVRSELSQCVQIDRPGSFFVEVNLSMIKSLGGVEAGLFMPVILEL